MESNLIIRIKTAIGECIDNGYGEFRADDGITVTAEWVDSKNEGYTVISITILENGVAKFSYDDYGTECAK